MEKQWMVRETITTERPIDRMEAVRIFGEEAVANYEQNGGKLLKLKTKTRTEKITKSYTNKSELEKYPINWDIEIIK